MTVKYNDSWWVKVLFPDKKSWKFLSSGGRVNSLRVHAVFFKVKTDAEEVAKEVEQDNPGVKTKVVRSQYGK